MKTIYDNALPQGWSETELRAATIRKRGYSWAKDDETARQEDGTVPVVRIPNIGDRLNLDHLVYLRNVPEQAVKEAAVSKGWILFVGSNGNPDRIGDSALMTEDRQMVFASFLAGIAPKNPEALTPEFFAAWMRLHRVHETFSKMSQQTTGLGNFSWGAVKRLPVRYPTDVQEQRSITELLATADSALSAADAKLIAARCLKTALMQQLFIRGIPDRHTRFKQTKIGEIPEEWDVWTIQQVLDGSPFNGVSPQSRVEPPGVPILNVSCIDDGECDPRSVSYVDVDEQTLKDCRAAKGDFYVLRGNGNREYVGTGGLLRVEPDPPCIFSDKLIRLRCNAEHVVENFIPLMWQSHTFLRRLQSKAESGSGLWMISKRDIRRECFAKPSKDEQREIVAFVEAARQNAEAAAAEVLSLERLKKSLVQKLLTGKVRVGTEVTTCAHPSQKR